MPHHLTHRFFLVDYKDQGEYGTPFLTLNDAIDAATAKGDRAVIRVEYEFQDTALVWAPDDGNVWPPDDNV